MPKIWELVKRKTQRIRFGAVKAAMRLLTPRATRTYFQLLQIIRRVPRPFTLALKQAFGNAELTGVEIGFGEGENARSLLKTLNIKRLYCVDPCHPYVQQGALITLYTNGNQEKCRRQISNNDHVVFVPLSSDEAWRKVGGGLDFVYVDGNHNFEFVRRDLANAWSHVRVGGFVGGHDYTLEFKEDVIRAVYEFAIEHGQVPRVEFPDFWFQKK
jgi:hypothetical protein